MRLGQLILLADVLFNIKEKRIVLLETMHQLHQLRVLGCEFGQGYLFAKPVELSAAEELLADQNRWKYILPQIKASPPRPTLNHELPTLELGDIN